MQRLRIVPVQAKDLNHQPTDALVAAFEKYQDARPGAAQGAAQQARRAQAQDFVEPRHQGFPKVSSSTCVHPRPIWPGASDMSALAP